MPIILIIIAVLFFVGVGSSIYLSTKKQNVSNFPLTDNIQIEHVMKEKKHFKKNANQQVTSKLQEKREKKLHPKKYDYAPDEPILNIPSKLPKPIKSDREPVDLPSIQRRGHFNRREKDDEAEYPILPIIIEPGIEPVIEPTKTIIAKKPYVESEIELKLNDCGAITPLNDREEEKPIDNEGEVQQPHYTEEQLDDEDIVYQDEKELSVLKKSHREIELPINQSFFSVNSIDRSLNEEAVYLPNPVFSVIFGGSYLVEDEWEESIVPRLSIRERSHRLSKSLPVNSLANLPSPLFFYSRVSIEEESLSDINQGVEKTSSSKSLQIDLPKFNLQDIQTFKSIFLSEEEDEVLPKFNLQEIKTKTVKSELLSDENAREDESFHDFNIGDSVTVKSILLSEEEDEVLPKFNIEEMIVVKSEILGSGSMMNDESIYSFYMENSLSSKSRAKSILISSEDKNYKLNFQDIQSVKSDILSYGDKKSENIYNKISFNNKSIAESILMSDENPIKFSINMNETVKSELLDAEEKDQTLSEGYLKKLINRSVYITPDFSISPLSSSKLISSLYEAEQLMLRVPLVKHVLLDAEDDSYLINPNTIQRKYRSLSLVDEYEEIN